MRDKDSQIAKLGKELGKQKTIFKENSYRAINPDGSNEYWAAKAKFDRADRKIKKLEKELARLITGGKPLDPPRFAEEFFPVGANAPAGVHSKPSQSKVISEGD